MSTSKEKDIKVFAKVYSFNCESRENEIYETTFERFLNGFRDYIEYYADSEKNLIEDTKNGKPFSIDGFYETCFDRWKVTENDTLEVDLNIDFMIGPEFDDGESLFADAMNIAFNQNFTLSSVSYYSVNMLYEGLECLNCHTTGYTWNNQRCDQCLSVLHNPERYAVVGPNIFYAPKEVNPWKKESDSWYLLTDEIAIRVFERFCGWAEGWPYFSDTVIEEDIGHEEVLLGVQGQEAERYSVSNIPETRPQPIEFPSKAPHYDGLLPKMKEIIRKSDRCDEFSYHLKLAGDKSLWLGDRSYHLLPPEIENEIMKICGVENWEDLYKQ